MIDKVKETKTKKLKKKQRIKLNCARKKKEVSFFFFLTILPSCTRCQNGEKKTFPSLDANEDSVSHEFLFFSFLFFFLHRRSRRRNYSD